MLKKKFEQDYASKDKSLNDELHDWTSKIDKVRAEIDAQTQEFEKKKEKMNSDHKDLLDSMEQEWGVKIDEEQERIEKLTLDRAEKLRK